MTRRSTVHRMATSVVVAACLLAASGCAASAPAHSGSASETPVAQPPDVKTKDQLFKGTYSNPPQTSPGGATGKSVWWIASGLSDSSAAAAADSAKAAARTLGINLKVADGKFNQAGGFTTAIRTALAAKPDAILLFGVACELSLGALQDARAQGVLVMGVETPDCSDSGGPKMFNVVERYSQAYPTVPELWRGYGAMAADYIINQSGGNAKVINSPGTEPLQRFIDEGFTTQLKKCSGCTIVASASYDSSKLTPNGPWIQSFRSALIAHPEANAAYVPFDFMMTILGAAQAVKESGRKVDLFGGQGTTDGIQAVRDGSIKAITTARDTGWSAYAAMDTINRALQGQPPVPEGIGFQLVTSDRNLPAAGQYVPPIDYKAAYEKAWKAGTGTK